MSLAALAVIAVSTGCAVRHAAHDPGAVVPATTRDTDESSPAPSAEEAARRALLEEEGAGDIPPSDRWIRPPTFPPSRPSEAVPGLNIRVNQDASGGDQNETVIRVNPVDPLNLVAGANDYRTGNVKSGYYASLDGGLTWTDGVLPETTYPFQGDPAVAFCADGSAVFASLSFTNIFQPHGIFFYRSTDGGVTWPVKTTVFNRTTGFPFADKEWIGCDTTGSPFANRIYVTWTDFGSTTPILLRWSGDQGATWSSDVRVSNGNSTQGSVIAIGPSGQLYVAWSDNGGGRIAFNRSINGGVSFGPDRIVSSVTPIPDDPFFRRNSFPVMDADRSGGSHSGSVYIAWSDNRNGDPDILFVRSTDGGLNWSAPIRVNDDPSGTGADQWFPGVTVDPNGRVIVTFHDRRRSPGGRPYEFWGAISRDGGLTFDTNFLISDTPSDGALNTFIGDYTGLAASADHLYPLWTDLRAGTGESDIYTDRFPNTLTYDEVTGLVLDGAGAMTWTTQDGRFGVNLFYDIVSGRLSDLTADQGFDRTSCLQSALDDPPFTDTRVPADGDGFWYLLRATGPAGVGTWGDGTPARPNARDPLDETLLTCP